MGSELPSALADRLKAHFAYRRESFRPSAGDAARVEAVLERMRAKRLADWPRHLAACGVPERERNVLLSASLNRAAPAFAALRSWKASKKPTLVLWGANGTGKSVAAASALWAATRTFRASLGVRSGLHAEWPELDSSRGLWIRAKELRHLPQERWQAEQTHVKGHRLLWWALAKYVPVLVVDELGREAKDSRGEWEARLNELHDTRHSAGLLTVYTTNLSPTEAQPGANPPLPSLGEWIGDAMADRLAQDSLRIEVAGASLRR